MVKIPAPDSSEKERFEFVYELINSLRRIPKGSDGVRRYSLTKEKFMELRWLMAGSKGGNDAFFDKAEKEGVEFGLYDDIAVLCGIAGPYYKDANGKDHVYIIVRS